MIREKETAAVNGLSMLAALLISAAACITLIVTAAVRENVPLALAAVAGLVTTIVLLAGLFMVSPNEGRVLQMFGRYAGTVKIPGLRWASPFYTKKHISLRVRNFETSSRLKVNDLDGNPIEMSAVVVFKVIDTAQALFQVDNYENFVKVSAEAAIRKLAMSYPYDTHVEGKLSLRGSPAEIAEHLRAETQERLEIAGVEILEARISNLSYAPEIAQAMLRRQQAAAVIAARQMIVDGSVGMVEMALERLSRHNVVQLDEERKATMVSNLLVVLCSETSTQPVINAGTLYQ